MADEIPTTISNVRSIEAPEPPKPGVMAGSEAGGEPAPVNFLRRIVALERKIEALERAVNGRVSE